MRREELPLGDKDRIEWVKACDDLISGFHNWKDNPLCKDFEAFIWTPKIGVWNNRLIILYTTKTEKFQPGTARLPNGNRLAQFGRGEQFDGAVCI